MAPTVGRGQERRRTHQPRTFLLADLRGYTRYTAEHGDAAGAKLTARFEALAREVVDEHEGSVFGTAGDQVLAAFVSARQALAASLALQAMQKGDGGGGHAAAGPLSRKAAPRPIRGRRAANSSSSGWQLDPR